MLLRPVFMAFSTDFDRFALDSSGSGARAPWGVPAPPRSQRRTCRSSGGASPWAMSTRARCTRRGFSRIFTGFHEFFDDFHGFFRGLLVIFKGFEGSSAQVDDRATVEDRGLIAQFNQQNLLDMPPGADLDSRYRSLFNIYIILYDYMYSTEDVIIYKIIYNMFISCHLIYTT